MQPQEETIAQFVGGYFASLASAARTDYNTFTIVLFAAFASIVFGIFRGLAYATGLYAVLHFLAGGITSISQTLAYIGNCVHHE